ncbi:MAG: acetylxylan esterase [Gemmataceae bacterium]|nr:acetylxylan esterase [Gemmataceae bacterium]
MISTLHVDFPPIDKLPAHKDLPDPLVMLDGKRVATKAQWAKERRPELKKLFQHYMYGEFPPPVKVTAKVEHEDPKALGGKATLRDITLTLGGKHKVQLLLVIPNNRSGPAPVFVGLNFAGNHTVLDHPGIRVPTSWMYGNRKGVKNNRATEGGRGSQIDTWAVADIIDRGFALATVYSGDIEPDRADVREGVQAAFDQGKRPEAWGTIAAWAWGIHRILDYLVTLPEVDAARMIVVGHSRLGKTALLAGALDERIAVVMPHQAGMGGTAPSRGTVGESIKRINTSFPHWFNGNYKLFNDAPEKLPFDQHCLVALCAPRPVLFTNAQEDTWANPDGQFEVLRAADPVYRLLGAGGLEAKSRPKLDTLTDGALGYWIRAGKHSMTREDWQIFVDYAAKHAKK